MNRPRWRKVENPFGIDLDAYRQIALPATDCLGFDNFSAPDFHPVLLGQQIIDLVQHPLEDDGWTGFGSSDEPVSIVEVPGNALPG